MEIKYDEYDDLIGSESEPSYWEAQPDPKRGSKRVSFDNILNGMNLVVDKSGVLKFMTKKTPTTEEDGAPSQQNNQSSQQNNQQLTPALKHSSIYNKYFKDYEDLNAPPPEIRVPKTMEEYKKMLWDDRMKKIKHQQLMSQIKPKQLLFVSNNNNINNRQPIKPSKNGLKKMSFN